MSLLWGAGFLLLTVGLRAAAAAQPERRARGLLYLASVAAAGLALWVAVRG